MSIYDANRKLLTRSKTFKKLSRKCKDWNPYSGACEIFGFCQISTNPLLCGISHNVRFVFVIGSHSFEPVRIVLDVFRIQVGVDCVHEVHDEGEFRWFRIQEKLLNFVDGEIPHGDVFDDLVARHLQVTDVWNNNNKWVIVTSFWSLRYWREVNSQTQDNYFNQIRFRDF